MGAAAGGCCRDSEDINADVLDQDSWLRQTSGSAAVVVSQPSLNSEAAATRTRSRDSAGQHGGGRSEVDEEEVEEGVELLKPRKVPSPRLSASSRLSEASEAGCSKTGGPTLSPESYLRHNRGGGGFASMSSWPRSNSTSSEALKPDGEAAAPEGLSSRLRRRLSGAKASLSRQANKAHMFVRRNSTGNISDMVGLPGARLKSPSHSGSSLALSKSTSSLRGSGSPPSGVRSPQPGCGSEKRAEIGNAVVALMQMVAGGSLEEQVLESRRSPAMQEFGRQMSDLIEALEDENPDTKAPFANHCYFYNLELRGRRPKCWFTAHECGQVHERIPDNIFEHMTFPSLQGIGSDSELRKRFIEIDTSNRKKLGHHEMREAIISAGVTPKRGQISTIMKLFREKGGEGLIEFSEFCLLGRMSLQWYNTLCSITPPHSTQASQDLAVKKFFAAVIQPNQSVQVRHLLALFQNADVLVDRATAVRLLATVDKEGDGCLMEFGVQRLFEALCIIAHMIQTGGGADAAEALGHRAKLVRAGVAAAFRGQRAEAPMVTSSIFGSRGVATDEIQKFFGSLGLALDAERLDRVIEIFDEDCNGAIEFDEFKRLYDISIKWHEFVKTLAKGASRMGKLSDTELRREFVRIDKDENGSIDLDELHTCFKSKGIKIARADLVKVMKLADTDGNNNLEWQEFRRMFLILSTASTIEI